jgi:hypothetical protein
MNIPDEFKGRTLLIATKHRKETVIASLMEQALGLTCIVAEKPDTDQFGTFTGEIARRDPPLVAVRKKCLAAMEAHGCDLGLASEGSFGPHPSLFFVPADDELLIFIDKKNNLEIMAREISTDTNFNGMSTSDEAELEDFARRARFPSHSLILRKSKTENLDIIKGINSWKELRNGFYLLKNKYGRMYAQTDMRAMCNPTRMLVIRSAAEKLVKKICSPCPNCRMPGFDVTEVVPGLPCERCGFPTRSTLLHRLTCQHCSHTQELSFPHNKQVENPAFCDWCNP